MDKHIDTYALVLRGDIMIRLAEEIFEGMKRDIFEENETQIMSDVAEEVNATFYYCFTGSAWSIDDEGMDDGCDQIAYYLEPLIIIDAKQKSTPFKVAYSDIDEMVEEFKNALGKCYPSGLDLRPYIRHVVGADWQNEL